MKVTYQLVIVSRVKMVESVFQVGMFMITAVIVTQVLQEGTVKSIFAVSQKIVMEGSAYPKILTLQTLCVFALLGKQECNARQVSTNQINNKINTLIEKDHLGDWSPEKDCC